MSNGHAVVRKTSPSNTGSVTTRRVKVAKKLVAPTPNKIISRPRTKPVVPAATKSPTKKVVVVQIPSKKSPEKLAHNTRNGSLNGSKVLVQAVKKLDGRTAAGKAQKAAAAINSTVGKKLVTPTKVATKKSTPATRKATSSLVKKTTSKVMLSGTERNYQILTSGPILKKKFVGLREAKAYVVDHAPLKRGWVGEWQTLGANSWCYYRINSKGVYLPDSYTIRLVRLPR